MKYTLSILLILMVSACSDDTLKEPETFNLPALQGKPETTQLVSNSWAKLLQHCPGLTKYQSDLSFSGINDMISPTMEEMSRAEIVFKVSNTSKNIPNSINAHGHTCGYGISPDGNLLRIQKSVCVSLCLGKKYNGSTDYVSPL